MLWATAVQMEALGSVSRAQSRMVMESCERILSYQEVEWAGKDLVLRPR